MDSTPSYHDIMRQPSTATTNPLILLLPSCILLLALDIAMRNAQRPRALMAGPSNDEDPSLITVDRLRAVSSKAQKVLADFKEYERRLSLIQRSPPLPPLSPLPVEDLDLPLQFHRRGPATLSPVSRSFSDSDISPLRRRKRGSRSVSPEFLVLCERLLQQKELQAQKKEIRCLKQSVVSSKKARDAAAFENLCNNLLQSHQLQKKEREIKELREDMEKEKRSRTGAVTRTAEQMALDVQKERMVEEFVKDVLKEAADSRRALVNLKVEHEKEVREMVSAWQKEQRQMKREIEQLRMAQAAKALEQEMSNELEDRLFESLEIEREAQYIDYDDADTYLEEMSVMSSSSTCVGSPSPSPHKQAHLRACCASNPGSPTPRPKVDPTQFSGFSFNPLFFGPTGSSSTQTPSRRASMSTMLDFPPPHRSRKGSLAGPTPLRSAWRV